MQTRATDDAWRNETEARWGLAGITGTLYTTNCLFEMQLKAA